MLQECLCSIGCIFLRKSSFNSLLVLNCLRCVYFAARHAVILLVVISCLPELPKVLEVSWRESWNVLALRNVGCDPQMQTDTCS